MTIEEIRKIVENDSETKGLKLSNLDVLTVYQYLNIRGTIVDGYKPILKTNPYIEIAYIPTESQTEVLNKERLKRNMVVFDSDVYLQDASLAKFDLSNNERVVLHKEATNFVENFSKENYVKGFYIYGKYSTGKTYLLSAIAHELVNKNITVLLVFMPDLVRKIKAGISSNDLEERINQLKRVDVLMLDDIGGEYMTPWFRDEILLPIIQYRLSAGLPMFFTSNLKLEELVESFAVSSNKVDYVKAVRLIQRIRDLTTYQVLGEEQFKKLKQSN